MKNTREQEIAIAAEALLKALGEDSTRDGLLKTPERVGRAWVELTSGYAQYPEEILGTAFEEGSYDELVIVKDIPFCSICEHHLFLFSGTVAVGYLPGNGRVVGLSKLARLVDCFAKRLQIQERMTAQIAVALYKSEILSPKAVGVVVRAVHSCMLHRGVRKAGDTVTSAMLGDLRSDGTLRSEFMELIK